MFLTGGGGGQQYQLNRRLGGSQTSKEGNETKKPINPKSPNSIKLKILV